VTTPSGRAEVWATYRVQLHRGFTFTDLANIAGYLSDLGVTHAYCSPSLQAAAGSTHGYDVVDPNRLNVELGGIEAYAALVDQLHSHGLGQVLDIVPNHMALDGRDNRWWWDVLANGPSSPYASYFDIDWDPPERKLMGSVLVPILGEQYGRVLDAGQIRVERSGGSFEVHYGDHTLPVSPRSINELLARAASQVSSEELAAMAIAFGELPHAIIRDPVLAAERQRGSRILGLRLRRLVEKQPDVAAAIDAELKEINDDPDELHQLLERQNYRLAFWRTASEELDYRRFFNIETLVGLRVEDPQVFADTHGLIGSLVAGGLVNGLRVDHIDGLRDPEGYLVRLSQATGAIWVVVEKILAPDEELPETWPVAGTTGYEFLNRVNGLFVAGENMAALTEGYNAFIGFAFDYPELVHDSKMQIMDEELAAEVERLTGAWALVSERHRCYRDYTRRELREALREVLACFPVYRTYVRPGAPAREADCRVIDQATTEACRRRPDLDADLLGFLGDLLRLAYPGEREEDLVARFQQLSGPVMAKGVEDTVFYRYNRLISLNEVGGSPDVVDGALARFHTGCQQTAERWPRTLLTLATHDTKRGPDTRSRINVLSEIPGPWRDAIARWSDHNDQYRLASGGQSPDRNDEYLLYQTLVGAWPIEVERVQAYMEKATKEAKVHTSWVSPDGDYDEAVRTFVASVLADAWFVADLERFLAEQRIVEAGRVNSLAQTVLLFTSPGFADLYQGTELWDHSLVDPDNRRPVDYEARRRLLSGFVAGSGDEPPAVDDTGAAKLWVTHRLLMDRRRRPAAYGPESQYRPLAAQGEKADHVVAFSRSAGLVTVVPRLPLGVDLARAWGWGDTVLPLPEGEWTDVLTGLTCAGGRDATLSGLLSRLPAAVLARG
jgi:(1->4)-alpha-D-glucan 1-alpha-D-glucosylmutase